MNRNNYFKYLRFDRLFTVVKLKQPSILWLAFLVSWFDNNSIYMWVVPCSPPKPRVLICCARPSHLKHWNSWKASAGPALHLAASPTRRLHFCPCSAFSSSLSHSFIRTLPPFTWSPWTPSFHWTWPAVPGQRSETENPFKMPTAEANTPQGWSSHHYCLPPGSFSAPPEKPCVRQQPLCSGHLCSAFHFPSYLDAGYHLGPLGLTSCTWCVCKVSGPCINSLFS